MAVKKGLGRGLSALLSDTEEEYDGSYKEEKSSSEAPNEISLSLIDPNVNQPRKVFDDATLSELTNSIRIHGVISPIIVVPAGDRYMIISASAVSVQPKRPDFLPFRPSSGTIPRRKSMRFP